MRSAGVAVVGDAVSRTCAVTTAAMTAAATAPIAAAAATAGHRRRTGGADGCGAVMLDMPVGEAGPRRSKCRHGSYLGLSQDVLTVNRPKHTLTRMTKGKSPTRI